MSASSQRGGLLRRVAPVAMMPPAAFAVHQLRYVLAFGAGAGAELQRTGHSYLHSVVPWVVALVALVAGGFLVSLGRAFSSQRSAARYTFSFAGLWLVCSVALVAVYACQELLEGALLIGHPPGLEGVFGYGGWWSVPVAVCVGLVLAAVFHGARWVLREVAERRSRPATPRVAAPLALRRPRPSLVPSPVPLASGWSDRGPPR